MSSGAGEGEWLISELDVSNVEGIRTVHTLKSILSWSTGRAPRVDYASNIISGRKF